MSTPRLACPSCSSTTFLSIEAAEIGYPVVVKVHAGTPSIDYTGDSYTVYDEGATEQNRLLCQECRNEFGVEALVDESAPAVGDVVRCSVFRGVACTLVEPRSGEIVAGQVVVVMVGDDARHVVDRTDVEPLDEDAYCGGCGQIGCGHGG